MTSTLNKTAILATGDEIIQGDTLNTNARDIAHELFVLGIPLGMRMATTDDEGDMRAAMEYLLQSHDILITIGGLGPTSDDRTRNALAQYAQLELVEDAFAAEHLANKHRSSGLPMVEMSKQQTMFPRGAQVLPNPNGSACGCRLDLGDKRIYMLPGPPRECLPMFQNYVLPDFAQRLEGRETLLRWRVFGIAESLLGDQVDRCLKDLPCAISYRWVFPYIDIKVRVLDLAFQQQIQDKLDAELKPLIISPPLQTASEVLVEKLAKRDALMTISDEATGGMLSVTLLKPTTQHAIRFVTPNEPADLRIQGLKEFWTNNNPDRTTSLTLQFDSKPPEQHSIPYRHDRVREYACEYLAFLLTQYLK